MVSLRGNAAAWHDGEVNVPAAEVTELPADAVLLDVREQDEWSAGHAPDAVHVPMSELTARLGEVPDAEKLFVICRSGGRSAQVTAYLNGQGHSAVNVAGGMQSWQQQGRPMVADSGVDPTVI